MLTYWRTLEGREARRLEGNALVLELPRWSALAHVESTGSPFAFSVEGTQGEGERAGGRAVIVDAVRADSTARGDVVALRAGQSWELAFRAG